MQRLLEQESNIKMVPGYWSWRSMRRRCYDENNNRYPYYGARGIEVCEGWRNSFLNFYKDMGVRPDGMTLDRIDNNGDYSPSNCRWATPKQQANNSRNIRYITYNNEVHNLSDWAMIRGIKLTTLRMRLDVYGWSTQRALGY